MNRRLFLRSAAATLWLPWLPSALPVPAAGSARAAESSPERLVFWFVPNGFVQDALSSTMAPLQPLRSRLTSLSMDNPAPGFTSHDHSLPSLLSDHRVPDIYDEVLQGSITADQFVAKQLRSVTPFPSLQLGTSAASGPGLSQYDAYVRAISWADATTPLRPTTDAKVAYDRMFAGSDPDATEAEIARRTALRVSVLDAVHERVQSVGQGLSAADRARLDQYATALREHEQHLELLSSMRCEMPPSPPANLPLAEEVAAHNELIALALHCDYTRVVTFMGGPSTSMATLPALDVREPHHVVSHGYLTSESQRTQLLTLERWYVEQYAALAARLTELSDSGGDLLSSTALVLLTEFGEGSAHIPFPIQVVVAGAERSGFRHGGMLQPQAPLGALMRTLIEHMGLDSSSFGTFSTGSLSLG